MLAVEQVAYYVPSEHHTLMDDFDRYNLTETEAKIYTKIYGLENIPVAHNQIALDLLIKPVQQLLDQNKIESKSIKYIIHSHTFKVLTTFGRSVVRELCDYFGFNQAVPFATTLNNCASALNALEMASVLLAEGHADDKALILTGELAYTPVVQVIPNTSITADAASAALVSRGDGGSQLISLHMTTHGQFSNGIWMDETTSHEFEKKYAKELAETINEVVRRAHLSLDDITLVLPHNVNLISWKRCAKELNISKDRIFLSNIKRYAHCFGADIFINYADAIQQNKIKPGDYFVMATVGLGATFAAAVFHYKGLNQ